jgi:hypothetical protein
MLLDAGRVEGASALVLAHPGRRSLDVLCGLIGRGCAAAAELPPDGPVPVEPVEIVLVPHLASPEAVTAALTLSQRCLLPCGRIVLQDGTGELSGEIVRQLRRLGFCNIRVRPHGDGPVVSADKAMFGPVSRISGHV